MSTLLHNKNKKKKISSTHAACRHPGGTRGWHSQSHNGPWCPRRRGGGAPQRWRHARRARWLARDAHPRGGAWPPPRRRPPPCASTWHEQRPNLPWPLRERNAEVQGVVSGWTRAQQLCRAMQGQSLGLDNRLMRRAGTARRENVRTGNCTGAADGRVGGASEGAGRRHATEMQRAGGHPCATFRAPQRPGGVALSAAHTIPVKQLSCLAGRVQSAGLESGSGEKMPPVQAHYRPAGGHAHRMPANDWCILLTNRKPCKLLSLPIPSMIDHVSPHGARVSLSQRVTARAAVAQKWSGLGAVAAVG